MKIEGNTRRNVLLLILVSAYLAMFVRFNESPVPYQNFVWFVYISNFFCSIGLVILQSCYFLTQPKSRFSRFFRSILLLLPICFSYFVIGGLMSFFAQMDPLEYFGPNGFINNFNDQIAWHHLVSFLPLFGFYLFKKLFFFDWSISRKLSGAVYIIDALLALACSAVLPLIFMKMGHPIEELKTLPELVGIMMFIVLMPWEIFFNRDNIGMHEEGIPSIYPESLILPLNIKMVGARGWGILVVIFGLVFVSVGLGAIMMTAKQGFAWEMVGALLVGSVFFLMGLVIVLIGFNLQYASKKVLVTASEILIEQTLFLPNKIYRRWSVLRTEFHPLSKEVRLRKNKNRRMRDYLVLLKRKEPVKKYRHWKEALFQDNEIILYKASFDEKHEEYFLKIRDVLGEV